MSRIIRSPYQPGDPADSTRANADFSAFSQAGAVDAANVRDAAIDLPQLASNIIILNASSTQIGTGSSGWQHTAPRTAPSSVATPATKTPLVDGSGNPTPLGPFVWNLVPGDVLRVYWDLSVRPTYQGSPWVGNYGEISITQSGGGTHTVNLGGHCWLISLQWDVVNASLTNWTDVSGQTAYTSAISGTVGGRLADSPASVPVPAWRLSSLNLLNGKWDATSVEVDEATGWTAANGAWFYVPSGNLTVYGLRLIIHGIYHPGQTATENYLILDTGVGGASQVLQYDGGTLTAIHQRIGA